MHKGGWQQRYSSARALLDNSTALAALGRAEREIRESGAADARVLEGEGMLQGARHVGLLAGSFNPLTTAHVTLAETARAAAGLDVVVWTCALVSVDKEQVTRAALADRLAQLMAYVRGAPGNALLLVNRGLYVDQALLTQRLVATPAEIAIVIGFDKVVQILDPRYYADREAALRELFAAARLLVAPRGRDSRASLGALLERPENRDFAAHITYLDVPAAYADASSTLARRLAASGAAGGSALTALVDLLPAEGVALTVETGAYAPPGSSREGEGSGGGEGSGEGDDAYAWRERWLCALADAPPGETQDLPPLHRFVATSLDGGSRGEAVRSWLRGERLPGGSLTLRDAARLSAPQRD